MPSIIISIKMIMKEEYMMKSSAQIVRNSGMKDVDWETICTLKVNLVNTTSHSLYNAPSSAPNSLAGNRGAFWFILS